jgi:hypothetical protein
MLNWTYITYTTITYLFILNIYLIYSLFLSPKDFYVIINYCAGIIVNYKYVHLLYKLNKNRAIEYMYNYYKQLLLKYAYIIGNCVYPMSIFSLLIILKTYDDNKYILSSSIIIYVNFQLVSLYIWFIVLKDLYARYKRYLYRNREFREYITPLINSLPISIIVNPIKENICAICLDEEEINEEWCKLSCSHNYHKNCIRVWILTKTNCPECRSEIRISHV